MFSLILAGCQGARVQRQWVFFSCRQELREIPGAFDGLFYSWFKHVYIYIYTCIYIYIHIYIYIYTHIYIHKYSRQSHNHNITCMARYRIHRGLIYGISSHIITYRPIHRVFVATSVCQQSGGFAQVFSGTLHKSISTGLLVPGKIGILYSVTGLDENLSVYLYIYIYIHVRAYVHKYKYEYEYKYRYKYKYIYIHMFQAPNPHPTPHRMVMQIHVYIIIKKTNIAFIIHLYQQPHLLAVKKILEPTWNRFPSQVPLPSYRIRKSIALLPTVALPGTAGWSFWKCLQKTGDPGYAPKKKMMMKMKMKMKMMMMMMMMLNDVHNDDKMMMVVPLTRDITNWTASIPERPHEHTIHPQQQTGSRQHHLGGTGRRCLPKAIFGQFLIGTFFTFAPFQLVKDPASSRGATSLV